MKNLLALTFPLLLSQALMSQCQSGNFSGLQSVYTCPNASVLFGNPSGGVFQGTGVSGNMFSPIQAGLGTHVISYTSAPSAPVAGYTATAGLTNAPESVALTTISLSDDQLSGPLPIGFDFAFYGSVYNQFRISSNGFITFDMVTNANGCCQGQLLPNNGDPNNVIAFAWNDFNPNSGGTIGYTTIGTAPNRILIVDFNNVPHYGGGGLPLTVQAKLFESNGNIEIHSTQNSSDGSPHTIGVENASGSCGIAAPGMNANANLSVVNQMVLFTADPGSYYGHQTGLPIALYNGPLTLLNLTNDALSPQIPLGFTFDFYGTNYNQAYISSNGFLTFSNDGNNGCCSGGLLPNAANPNNLIAFAWNDLNPALGGTIGYTTIGSAPNRVFVLDFANIQHAGGGNPVTVQVKLFETSNLVEVHSTQNTSNGSAMTMGLENATGTEANTPAGRNANGAFNVVNERTIFRPYYTSIQTTQVISVTDEEAPQPDNPSPEPVIAQCSVTSLEEQFAIDNCSEIVAGNLDATFPITESTTVTWTFTDASGNVSTATQEVIIDDITAPVASGFVITITAQGFSNDEVFWSFTNGSGSVVASGGPYTGGGFGSILEQVVVSGINGPFTFMGTTAGVFNDNSFGYTIQCQGQTVLGSTVTPGQTVTIPNIAACNVFTPISANCQLNALPPVSAIDNCAGQVQGTNNAVFPITSSTVVTWTFDDGNGNTSTEQQEVTIFNLNTEILFVTGSLMATENTAGVTYSWVDCNNNFAPLGVFTPAFTPTANGSYAVVLTIGDCSVTSPCFVLNDLNLEQNDLSTFQVYPNPANGSVTINSTVAGQIEIIDMSGKVVRTNVVEPGAQTLDVQELSSGTYTIRMIAVDGVYNQRFVVSR